MSAEELKKDKSQVEKRSSFNLRNMDFSSSNMSDTWKAWKLQYKIYLRASNLEAESDRRKVAILLHNLGPDAIPLFNSFNLDLDKVSHDELIEKFEAHCTPKKNLTMERYKFFSRKQSLGETIEDFCTTLKNLSFSCEFESQRESLVKSIFILGLLSEYDPIREKLLQEDSYTLEQALQTAQTMERSRRGVEKINTQNTFIGSLKKTQVKDASRINNYWQRGQSNEWKRTPWRVRSKSKSGNVSCGKCGQSHAIKQCPAFGSTCHSCYKKNHYSKMCTKKSVKNISTENENFYIANVTKDNIMVKDNSWMIDIKINKKNVKALLDTGAQVNVMPVDIYKSLALKWRPMQSSNIKLLTFSGQKLVVVGCVDLYCEINGLKTTVPFQIVDLDCSTVLGINTCTQLKLVECKVKLIKNISIEQMKNEYKDVFEGLGCLSKPIKLVVDENVKPVIDPIRKVPFSLIDELRKEFDKMESMGVIAKVEKPTVWASSITVVRKPNGSLRICLDPRNLNKAIVRPRFPLPNFDEIRTKLNNAKYFTKVDASSGFWNLQLDENSSYLCTFNTPFGRYRFCRLPFGISASSEIYQQKMVEMFGDIENLIIFIDDFLIYSKTREEHDKVLRKVLERCRTIGLKLNLEKCEFLVNKVKYLGHIFFDQGVIPDPERIKAIKNMKIPNNVKELQRFMGVINYLGPFIQNLASMTENLRKLLRKDVMWQWELCHDTEFDNLKTAITTCPVLGCFEIGKPTTLSVDSSKDAMGAVLLQKGRPIAYASTTLNSSQVNYSQIEKELLAVVYGCTKFDQYIFGIRVNVETDHKPLISIVNKPISKIPPRLQRLVLKLQKYNINLIYTPGKYMYIADTLSRTATSEDKEFQNLDKEIEMHVHLIKKTLAVSDHKLELLKKETLGDETLQKVVEYTKTEWPCQISMVDADVQPYYKFRGDISSIDGLLFKDTNLLIIPPSMRRDILKTIHEGHLGIERCKQRARTTVYWPNINNDIKNMVNQCEPCLKYRSSNVKLPLMSHEIGGYPWEKVGMDLFHIEKKTYMIVTDYYSKFVEVALLNDGGRGDSVITSLKSIFARFGIPRIAVSDNGPPYNSENLKIFFNEWDIEHIKTSPYFPKSNGLVERSIGTVKKMLIKCVEDKTDPYLALLNYRNTPKGRFESPAKLLMSRNLRTKLPTKQKTLRPKTVSIQEHLNKVHDYQKKTKKYYDKHAKELEPILVGDEVMFKIHPKSSWVKGRVKSKCKEPRSFIIERSECTYRRNRQHLHKIPTTGHKQEDQPLSNVDFEPTIEKKGGDSGTAGQYRTRSGRLVKPVKRYGDS